MGKENMSWNLYGFIQYYKLNVVYFLFISIMIL